MGVGGAATAAIFAIGLMSVSPAVALVLISGPVGADIAVAIDAVVAVLTGFGIALSGAVSLTKLTASYVLPTLPTGR